MFIKLSISFVVLSKTLKKNCVTHLIKNNRFVELYELLLKTYTVDICNGTLKYEHN